MRPRRLIAIFVLLLPALAGAATSNASAAVYHVSPTGRANGAGTVESPWSLAKANHAVQPGDTIILADGIYSGPIRPARSGLPGAPITYRSSRRHKAVFVDRRSVTDQNKESVGAVEISDRSYIVIDGIAARDVHRWIIATGSSHIAIRNCSFANSQGWESCRFRNTGDGIVLANNVFVNGSDLVSIGPGSGHLIEFNTFDGASHTCLVLLGSQRSVVRNNRLRNPRQKLMEVFSARWNQRGRPSQHVLIERNLFDYTGSFKRRGGSSSAIQFAGKDVIIRRNIFQHNQSSLYWAQYTGRWGEAGFCRGNRIYHNVFFENGRPGGFRYNGPAMIFSGRGGKLLGDNVVANNIFFANRHYEGRRRFFVGFPQTMQILFHQSARPAQTRFYGNDILCAEPGEVVIGGVADKENYTFTLAEFQAAFPATARDNIGADPKFTDPADGDFQLLPDSPCIDAASPLTQATKAGQGKVLAVEDARFFTDGHGIIEPDVIRVGGMRVVTEAVDYQTNRIRLTDEISWPAGAPVSLDYEGDGPDIGAFEFGSAKASEARYGADHPGGG